MPRSFTLAEKLALLFDYGEEQGLNITYRAIAEATRENANPGVRTLTALASYFQVGLAYFDCTSRAACQDFLRGATERYLTNKIALRSTGLSEAGKEAILNMIEFIRDVEKQPPSDQG